MQWHHHFFAYWCAICIFISRGRGEIRKISDFIYTLIQVSSVCIKMILHRPQVHTSLNRDKEISLREMGTRPRRPLSCTLGYGVQQLYPQNINLDSLFCIVGVLGFNVTGHKLEIPDAILMQLVFACIHSLFIVLEEAVAIKYLHNLITISTFQGFTSAK